MQFNPSPIRASVLEREMISPRRARRRGKASRYRDTQRVISDPLDFIAILYDSLRPPRSMTFRRVIASVLFRPFAISQSVVPVLGAAGFLSVFDPTRRQHGLQPRRKIAAENAEERRGGNRRPQRWTLRLLPAEIPEFPVIIFFPLRVSASSAVDFLPSSDGRLGFSAPSRFRPYTISSPSSVPLCPCGFLPARPTMTPVGRFVMRRLTLR